MGRYPTKAPEQLRRPNRGLAVGSTLLPARGRVGRAPTWPLPPAAGSESQARELALWRRLWHLPQACQWEEMGAGVIDVVARYCRLKQAAEARYATATILNEVRQLEDRLGLTPLSMLRLKWVVAPAAEDVRDIRVTDLRARVRAVAD